MGIKTRGNYPVNVCLKYCLNRNIKCNDCLHYSNYKLIPPKQLFIIGNGTSLSTGIEKGLWTALKNKFTINMNFGYQHFVATILTFVDYTFYIGCKSVWRDTEEKRLKHIENIKNIPLIIGANSCGIRTAHPNTILFKTSDKYYGRKSIKEDKIYRSNLTGILSMTLGINLLDIGEIYLLGMDGGPIGKTKEGKKQTHFDQNNPNLIKHDGHGKIAYYEDNHEERDYKVYQNDPKIKMFNVGINSQITQFHKITYDQFFTRLDNNQYNQEELRLWVRNRINALKKS